MKKERRILYNFFKVIYTVLLKILYRPKVIGKENIPKDGALILAGNHRRAFDPVMVMMSTKRYVHYMAKEEVYFGLHGLIFKALGVIKIYKNKSGNVKSVMEAERILNSGSKESMYQTLTALQEVIEEQDSKEKSISLELKKGKKNNNE